jgi:cytidylate kinase
VGQIASQVATVDALRTELFYFQRHLLDHLKPGQYLVMDGRDIGTVIFPDAWLKFYVTATVAVRSQPAWMVCAGNPCRPLKPRRHPWAHLSGSTAAEGT